MTMNVDGHIIKFRHNTWNFGLGKNIVEFLFSKVQSQVECYNANRVKIRKNGSED